MLANAAAHRAGLSRVHCTLDGLAWSSNVFRYQAKCLDVLRAKHRVLPSPDRARVDALLSGTGCDALFAEAGSSSRL